MSHVNTDFDALASLIAAKKLHPEAKVVIPNEQTAPVRQFLTIYRDTFDMTDDHLVKWEEVTSLILVDTASLSRLGNYTKKLDAEKLDITVYDHHPPGSKDVKAARRVIEPVGATVTLLIEEIIRRKIPISSFEATLFGLGIYTDTGSFTFPNTTDRDFQAASFLMKNEMNLEIIQRFADYKLTPDQQDLLNQLFRNAKTYYRDGLKFLVCAYQIDVYLRELATIADKLLDISGADMVLTVVKMEKHVHIVGRCNSNRVNLLPLLEKFDGGGHPQAGSATVKRSGLDEVLGQVNSHLDLILKPAITAEDIMASPVKMLPPDTKIREAGHLMYRYGHSGYPVVEDDRLIGIITRRDLDKANHHGLGHAPIKAYMSRNPRTIKPETTIEEMQRLIIDNNIGRLPVMEDGQPIGIVTRTDIIEVMHNQELSEDLRRPDIKNLKEEMEKQLPESTNSLLTDISRTAERTGMRVYLIGGIVRDLFLERPNDDIDIVVEGNGIDFAEHLRTDYGGSVKMHETFGTASWIHPSGLYIDVTSARLEYYERPASLPDVELSTLSEDLYRRDFTINSMALCLNPEVFGDLVDPFNGQADLRSKTIKVLHNLSFIDDPTRILRAVRFETRFDFLMDKQTESLALNSMARMRDLSAHRIVEEMKRLFKDEDPPGTIKRLFKLTFWQQFGVDDGSAEQSYIHAGQLKMFYEIHKPPAGTKPRWFNYFAIPFFTSKKMYLMSQFSLTKRNNKFLQDIRNLSDMEGVEQIREPGEFHRFLKHYEDEAIIFMIAKENMENEDIITSYLKRRIDMPVFLTGEDLIQEGMKPGPHFRGILLELEVAVLNGEINTRDEAVAWLHENHMK
ncbi:CBS domain-containing protein [Salinicoccus halitifaciens]|uniref:tRNA nucleotidyltransferase (CCA-adding enzyme) n=1 Tax=Salinicoccus halitifaciens TaxID=1073415 RepID=A0ABV2EAU7_9STAP|nr:CBS domain-containing protein [Salinicoccus halitifaciens]MCD2137605.1 CBS domain-containing protein [Salinicoccus halitifaciens]